MSGTVEVAVDTRRPVQDVTRQETWFPHIRVAEAQGVPTNGTPVACVVRSLVHAERVAEVSISVGMCAFDRCPAVTGCRPASKRTVDHRVPFSRTFLAPQILVREYGFMSLQCIPTEIPVGQPINPWIDCQERVLEQQKPCAMSRAEHRAEVHLVTDRI